MPRRRPECGAARAAGGSGPGGPVRRDRSCKDTGVQERGGKPGLRSEAGSRAADARNATQTRAARSEEGGIRTALHERAAKQETQKGPKAGRTCRRGNCSKAHVPQPQKSPQDRVRMPKSQRDPQKNTRRRRDARRTGCGCRSRRGARRKAHAAAERPAGQGADAGVAEEPAGQGTEPEPQRPRRSRENGPAAPCTGGASPQRAVRCGTETGPGPPPDFHPTSAGRARAASGASHRANGPSGKNKSPRLHSVGLFG